MTAAISWLTAYPTNAAVEMTADWNSNLAINNGCHYAGRIEKTILCNGYRLGKVVTITGASSGEENQLYLVDGTIGLRESDSGWCSQGYTLVCNHANVCLRDMEILGRDIMSPSQCTRGGSGDLIHINGYSTFESADHDTLYTNWPGCVKGSVDFIGCTIGYKVYFNSCSTTDFAVKDFLFAEDARVRIEGLALLSNTTRRFYDSMINTEGSLLFVTLTDAFTDLVGVSGGGVINQAAAISCTGSADDAGVPYQVYVYDAKFFNCDGECAGAVYCGLMNPVGTYHSCCQLDSSKFEYCDGGKAGAIAFSNVDGISLGYNSFTSNTSSTTADHGGGGAVFVESDKEISAPRIQNCTFTSNSCAIDYAGGAVQVNDAGLWLTDTRFLDNARRTVVVDSDNTNELILIDNVSFDPDPTYHTSGLRIRAGVAQDSYIRNCLFAPTIPTGTGYTYCLELDIEQNSLNPTPFLIDGVTLARGGTGVRFDSNDHEIELKNLSLQNVSTGILANSSNQANVTVAYTNFDTVSQPVIPTNLDRSHTSAHSASFVGGTGPIEDQYELRWDSALLDIGDPESELDYDLSQANIGWYKELETEELIASQVSAGNLDRKVYEITATDCDLVLNTALPVGSVLRVAAGSSLRIRPLAHGNSLKLGDEDGPRTALVGVQSEDDLDPCNKIEIGAYRADPFASVYPTTLVGVYFSYAPEEGIAFNHCDLEVVAPEVRFNDQAGTGEALIEYKYSKGRMQGHNLNGTQFGRVYQYRSSVDMAEISFPVLIDDAWSLYTYRNHQTDSRMEFDDLVFPGSRQNNTYDSAVAYLYRSTIDLDGCSFTTSSNQNTPFVYENLATLNMSKNARNSFDDDGHNSVSSLVYMYYGELKMDCGYNSFIRQNYVPPLNTPTFIGSTSATWTHEYLDWGINFWGTSCSDSYPISTILTNWDIPNWQNLSEWGSPLQLSTCNQAYTGCSGTGTTPSMMLAEAQSSLDAGDAEAALLTASDLILQYPNSVEAYEATEMVSSIALETETGALNYADAVATLEAASEQTASTDRGLSTMQSTDAKLVEARHGARSEAVAALQQVAETSAEPVAIMAAELALLEIDTWPAEGGLATASPAQAAAHTQRIRQASNAIRDYLKPDMTGAEEQGALEALTMPGSISLASAFPNPFNPVTMVEFGISSPIQGTVSIYNMVGQQVATLFDGQFEQGLNRVAFDGSQLASGVYLVSIQTPQDHAILKTLLLK